ncbi:MAG: uroporphyrinogen-III C-methyltransferase, partial [Bacilli bacterium]
AKEGKCVTRLKGGDPSIFGRVGEECEALHNHHIPYEIVPGITSGVAASTYAGITVTHRDVAGSVAFVTAHSARGDGHPDVDWNALAKGIDTLVFYMGIKNLPHICEQLIEAGRDKNTPVAIVGWGTYSRQRVLLGTLESMPILQKQNEIPNPALTIVGETVALREKLAWFEKLPLHGRNILIVRTGIEKSSIAEQLKQQGADVLEYPKWKSVQCEISEKQLDIACSATTLEFTNPESIDVFMHNLKTYRKDIRHITGTIVVRSKKTQRKLADDYGIQSSIRNDATTLENHVILCNGQDKINLCVPHIITHDLQVDSRYTEIAERAFVETPIDTVIFPSCKSVSVYEQLVNNENIQPTVRIAMGESIAALLPEETLVLPSYKDILHVLKGER